MSLSDEHSSVLNVVLEQSRRSLQTYRNDPGRIQEDANGERRIKEGGYGDRQIYELVQNGADELRNGAGGKIAVVLTGTYLYCANEGDPITPQGAETILRMGVSRKRGGQIGRFGVGVKSVLSVTDSPQFFSRDDDKSFGFDREWAAEQIRKDNPDAQDIPVLRMAQPLDRDQAKSADPILAELLEWATTVVRLPLKPTQVNRLGRDLENFPIGFLLFSSHVRSVILDDRRSPAKKRVLVQQVQGDLHILQDGNGPPEEWRVFTRTFEPPASALEDAGELHNRPKIDVSWAVPAKTGRDNKLGQFWAYFPTNYTTTLRGILNAPWKTSEDRQNLYGANKFNDQLILAASDLVVDSLAELSRPDDLCAHLDSVPARGREEPQWAAKELVKTIWQIAAMRPALPGQDGRFGTVSEIRLHPAGLKSEWLKLWADHSGRPANWCDHSTEFTAHRRQSAERILGVAGVPVATAREWLEALVQDKSPEASGRAILILSGMRHFGHPEAEQALKSKILLTEAGTLVAPSPNVFRRSSEDGLADQITYVDPRVVADDAIRHALDELGVHEADAAGRFASVVEQGFAHYTDTGWERFWELSRQVSHADVLKTMRDCKVTPKQLKVKTVAGGFRRVYDCLAPGRVVPDDGSRDAHIAVDNKFHRPEMSLLRDLGLLEAPSTSVDPSDEPWFEEYRETFWKAYCRKLPANASRPMLKTMRFDGSSPAGPLHFLTELSEEGRAAFLGALPRYGLVSTWRMVVGSQQSTQIPVPSPLKWAARKYGFLLTSRGLVPVTKAVGPTLSSYSELMPVAKVESSIAEVLALPGALSTLPSRFWSELAKEAESSTEDAFPGKVYALFLDTGVDWPEGVGLRCRVGDSWSDGLGPDEIAVASTRTEYDELIREAIPAVLAPSGDAADQMREAWDMLSPAELIEKDLRFVAQTDPVLLIHEFPHLKVLHRHKVDGWSLVRCDELEEVVRTPNGTRMTSVKAALQNHTVLALRPKDDLEALVEIDRHLKLGLGPAGCKSVLERREQQRNNERLRRAREAQSTAEKVLLLVGEKALREGLPQGLLESEEAETGRKPDAERIAQLAVDAHGAGLLRHHSKDLAAVIPEAGASFRGDNKSLQLVNQVQLPESFAGARSQRPDPAEVVSGPTAFPRLHDYQEKLASKMFDLLTRHRAPRAMLCMPTGAGKTRVAAEAVIRVIKENGLGGRPVLWIAQTAELCEQAVQSWKFVWSKVGPEESLTISRLWESNEAAAVTETVHLVVATDAKLEQCLDTPDYAWLRDAALVLVDEAHVSTTPRYTRLLESLGITHRHAARPLIGLTATPFRGFSKEQTERLAGRYGRLRLDEGVFAGDPYEELQELEVLARVEHRELTGATISLTAAEREFAASQSLLPRAAEQRLADDHERTAMLVRTIAELPDDGPVLLFATSVNHAKVMAAKLNSRKIKAAAIDSATPPSERRRIIDEYRTGKIRVITNYGVLAQGFDAPATRTVIVARPTYSPNTYQQMIGRGLRGPKNGGKEVCRILDVRDNITNFDKKLAFTDFEYLWSRG